MTGRRFGKLQIVRREGTDSSGHAEWMCRCECGTKVVVRGTRLRSSETQSCGCLGAELSRQRNYGNRQDLTDQKFGRWTVLGFDHSRPGQGAHQGGTAIWRCRCDCGVVKLVAATTLKSASDPKCRSCAQKSQRKEDWWIKRLLKRYRLNANSRGLRFELSDEDFIRMLGEPCFYCGVVRAGVIRNDRNPDRVYRHNGIDRLNGGNYSLENCAPCCWSCNRAKSDMTAAEFLEKCRTIAARHPAENL